MIHAMNYILKNSFVALNGCRIWIGGKNSTGYGTYNGNLVHRIAYEHYHPEVSIEGYMVCHACDKPLCISKDHLFLGTALINNVDKILKGRDNIPSGLTHYKSKFTLEQIIEIRTKAKLKGFTKQYLANKFEVDRHTIQDIVSRKRYSEIP